MVKLSDAPKFTFLGYNKHAWKLIYLFLFVENLREREDFMDTLYFKSWISTRSSHSTLNVLAEETGTSAWYQALPASPVRLQICCSVLSRVSCRWMLNVPIPLPNMWVQNLMQSGMSTPETTKSDSYFYFVWIRECYYHKLQQCLIY